MGDFEKIQLGVVGLGNFGRWRLDKLRQTGLFEVRSCFDVDAEVCERVAARERAQAARSLDEFLETKGLEAVVVSTGADTHAPLALAAVDAGKHVFIEKPLCSTPQEMRALLEARKKTGLVFGVGHKAVNAPVDRIVRQYMESGRLGQLMAISLHTMHGPFRMPAWQKTREKNPGGMLFQCGVHQTHWMQSLFGPVTEVMSMMRYDINPQSEAADVCVVLYRLASGVLVTQHAHHVTAYEHTAHLYGTLGTLYTNETPEEVFFQERREDGGVESRVAVPLSASEGPDDAGTTNLISWARAIRGQGQPDPGLEEGARAVAVIFAAVESAEKGTAVRVPDLL
ncbi:MAG: Gfo/Idh/MocA family oxidoreductase [Verrucomicrobiae bacterium]|nr:Gfo/Idh/MocA family oxidoreductase [Verrucomicrobiae bacterium]